MDVSVTINIWFLVSVCLVFTLLGMFLGIRTVKGRNDRLRY